MLTTTELLAGGLAACALIDIWRGSSLLATPRAWIEARGGRLAEWASCRLCLSQGVAALTAVALAAHGGPVGHAIVTLLAVGKAARLAHDYSEDRGEELPALGDGAPEAEVVEVEEDYVIDEDEEDVEAEEEEEEEEEEEDSLPPDLARLFDAYEVVGPDEVRHEFRPAFVRVDTLPVSATTCKLTAADGSRWLIWSDVPKDGEVADPTAGLYTVAYRRLAAAPG